MTTVDNGAMKENEARKYNLYFIIRSMLSASIGFFTFSFIALMLGSLTGFQAIILNIACFAYPVLLTKLLHRKLQGLIERIFGYLEKNERMERLVTKISS